jgi:hypothetical protein
LYVTSSLDLEAVVGATNTRRNFSTKPPENERITLRNNTAPHHSDGGQTILTFSLSSKKKKHSHSTSPELAPYSKKTATGKKGLKFTDEMCCTF